MAFQRKGQHDQQFIADTKAELDKLKNVNMGSSCLVIDEAAKYIVNSKGEWIRQRSTQPKTTATATPATFSRNVPAVADTCNCRPIKYEVNGIPEGTIVDYREKEIRIWCPEDVEWNEFENTDIDYGNLRAYAPAGAESCRLTFDNESQIIVSSFGYDGDREYVIQTLPLAHYDESEGVDRWVYNGENSEVGNYAGWTLEFMWYDGNNKLIDCDRIRVNLSNKNCHLEMAPYYG